MKKILMFAALSGIAAAISIYFVTESQKASYDDDGDYGYITDADVEAFDMRENTGRPETV